MIFAIFWERRGKLPFALPCRHQQSTTLFLEKKKKEPRVGIVKQINDLLS